MAAPQYSLSPRDTIRPCPTFSLVHGGGAHGHACSRPRPNPGRCRHAEPRPSTPTPAPTTAASPPSPPSATRKLSGGFGRKPGGSGQDEGRPHRRDPPAHAEGWDIQRLRHADPGETDVPVEGEGSEPFAKAGDEATWKARVATLRAELAQAEKDYDVADKANTVVRLRGGETNTRRAGDPKRRPHAVSDEA